MEVYSKSEKTKEIDDEQKEINPENPIDIKRLVKSATKSYKKCKIFRENRYKFIKESVGSHYGEKGTAYNVPINLLRLWQNIYTRSLVAEVSL